jgi:alkylhydroperoxidase family enzyme
VRNRNSRAVLSGVIAHRQSQRRIGYDDAQIIEIVQHVALNTWTNYIDEVAKTGVDFPVIAPRKAA